VASSLVLLLRDLVHPSARCAQAAASGPAAPPGVPPLLMAGLSVILTVHQPSSAAFHCFDKVLVLCEGRVVFYGQPSYCMSYITSFDFSATKSLLARQTYRGDNPHGTDPLSGKTDSCNAGSGTIAYNPADLLIELLYSNAPVTLLRQSNKRAGAETLSVDGPGGQEDEDEEEEELSELSEDEMGSSEKSESSGSGIGQDGEDIEVGGQAAASSVNLLAVCAPRYSLMFYYDEACAQREVDSCLSEVDVGIGAEGECKEAWQGKEEETGQGWPADSDEDMSMYKRKVPFMHQVSSFWHFCGI
jgi:hypothetical protein